MPRPDVTPPSVGTFLLYAQGQQIGHLPLNGTRLQKDAAKTLLSLHVQWISPVGVWLHEAFGSGQGLEVEGGPGGFLGCSLVSMGLPSAQHKVRLPAAGSYLTDQGFLRLVYREGFRYVGREFQSCQATEAVW